MLVIYASRRLCPLMPVYAPSIYISMRRHSWDDENEMRPAQRVCAYCVRAWNVCGICGVCRICWIPSPRYCECCDCSDPCEAVCLWTRRCWLLTDLYHFKRRLGRKRPQNQTHNTQLHRRHPTISFHSIPCACEMREFHRLCCMREPPSLCSNQSTQSTQSR